MTFTDVVKSQRVGGSEHDNNVIQGKTKSMYLKPKDFHNMRSAAVSHFVFFHPLKYAFWGINQRLDQVKNTSKRTQPNAASQYYQRQKARKDRRIRPFTHNLQVLSQPQIKRITPHRIPTAHHTSLSLPQLSLPIFLPPRQLTTRRFSAHSCASAAPR